MSDEAVVDLNDPETPIDLLPLHHVRRKEKKLARPRPCIANQTCLGNRSPGDRLSWPYSGPLPYYLTELTPDEAEEIDEADAENAERDPEGVMLEGDPKLIKQQQRDSAIRGALEQLDPEKDGDWTNNGMPKVKRVNQILKTMDQEPTKLSEIRHIQPDIVRPSGADAGGDDDDDVWDD